MFDYVAPPEGPLTQHPQSLAAIQNLEAPQLPQTVEQLEKPHPPYFTKNLENVEVFENEVIDLNGFVEPRWDPFLVCEWERNGAPIPMGTATFFFVAAAQFLLWLRLLLELLPLLRSQLLLWLRLLLELRIQLLVRLRLLLKLRPLPRPHSYYYGYGYCFHYTAIVNATNYY